MRGKTTKALSIVELAERAQQAEQRLSRLNRHYLDLKERARKLTGQFVLQNDDSERKRLKHKIIKLEKAAETFKQRLLPKGRKLERVLARERQAVSFDTGNFRIDAEIAGRSPETHLQELRKTVLDVARKYGKNKWWRLKDARQAAYYQLHEPVMIMDAERFHEGLEWLLNREVPRHELFLTTDKGIHGLEKEAKAAFRNLKKGKTSSVQTKVNWSKVYGGMFGANSTRPSRPKRPKR